MLRHMPVSAMASLSYGMLPRVSDTWNSEIINLYPYIQLRVCYVHLPFHGANSFYFSKFSIVYPFHYQ